MEKYGKKGKVGGKVMERQREENMSKAVKDREPPANHQPREGQAGGRG